MSPSVLICDDDAVFRRSLVRPLQRAGYELVEAADGDAGLCACVERDLALLIVDLVLPRMDGLEMLAVARDRGCSAPAFVMAEAERPVFDAAALGVMEVFRKPLELEQLSEAVERVLTSGFGLPLAEQLRVHEAAAFINARRGRNHELHAAIEIGGYILDVFYGGQYERFAHKSPTKQLSWKALTTLAQFPSSEATLYKYVRIAHQARTLPRELRTQLSVSHHYELLGVSDLHKEALLRAAIGGCWSVRQLKTKIVADVPPSPRGRKRRPRLVKMLHTAHHALEQMRELIDDDRRGVRSLSRAQRAEAVPLIAEVRQWSSAILETLGQAEAIDRQTITTS